MHRQLKQRQTDTLIIILHSPRGKQFTRINSSSVIEKNITLLSQLLLSYSAVKGWLDSRVVSVAGLRRKRAQVQIAVATLSGNSLGQTVHTHCASVHKAAKLVAALLRVAGVTAGLAESNGSLLPGL